jgi:hypothetical protein
VIVLLTDTGPPTTAAAVSLRDPRNHQLWPLLVENLAHGRREQTALAAGGRVISYGRLAAAVEHGGEEIDAQFAAGSLVLVAARNQLHVGIALLAALRSRAIPLLADPTSPERLRGIVREWRVSGAIGERGVLTPTGVPIVDAARIDSWLAAPIATSPHSGRSRPARQGSRPPSCMRIVGRRPRSRRSPVGFSAWDQKT